MSPQFREPVREEKAAREDYDQVAERFRSYRQFSLLNDPETYTYFKRLGDLKDKTVLDLACGEGFYTRQLKQQGASRVVGVDRSAAMLALAQQAESDQPLGIEYRQADVFELALGEQFNCVVAAYLLNCAQTPAQLLSLCTNIHRHLQSGGWFFTVNHNLDLPIADYPKLEKYGIRKELAKELAAELVEGTPINVRLTVNAQGETILLEDCYLSRSTYVWALTTAGFSQIEWYTPEVSPQGLAQLSLDYWQDFLHAPHMMFIRALA
uniref:Methyltransferase type 11 n=1 Tax=Cyanothece sp. (strain PCC 7425 / ATCC 29141) TaxID=395961 RepID=B8HWX8_CYAP4